MIFKWTADRFEIFSKPTNPAAGNVNKRMVIVPAGSSKENLAQGRLGRINSAPGIQLPADETDGTTFNFRQMLRKTDYAPTDTLRKMKEQKSFD